MEQHGLEPFQHPNEVLPAHEAFFRDAFLSGIRREPIWYAGVLARRALATATQVKLWPWTRWHGRSVGGPLFHYKYITPADWFGFRGGIFEVPLALLWLPLVLLSFRALRARASAAGEGGTDSRRVLALAGLCALCTLPLPVVVSTASAIETQAFALVYLIALAFLLQDLVRSAAGASARKDDQSAHVA